MTTQQSRGSRALQFAERWLDPVTVQRVVVPAVADLEHELRETGGSRFSRWRVALRGYWGLWKAIGLSLIAERARQALPSLSGIALRMTLFFPIAMCLAMSPFVELLTSSRFSGLEGRLFLLLLPQAVTVALPVAYLFAAALDRSAISPKKLLPPVIGVSAGLCLVALVSSAAIVPLANQAYRQQMFQHLTAAEGMPPRQLEPGPNELTLGAVWRDARRAGPAGDVARRGLSNRLATAALPIVFGIVACGIASQRRRRWLVATTAALLLALYVVALRAGEWSPFAAPSWEWLWVVIVNAAFTAIGLALVWWRSKSPGAPVPA